VGGATLMTAQWSPWFTFELGQRVPARAFTPAPGVDRGMLIITRRKAPLLAKRQRKSLQAMAYKVFTGRGRGIVQITSRAKLFNHPREAQLWASDSGLDRFALPKDLSTDQWVDLYRISRSSPGKR